MCYRRIDRTIVKYLKNKAIIFIESDSMLQKKKKKEKNGELEKKDRDARFSRPDKAGKVTGIFPV